MTYEQLYYIQIRTFTDMLLAPLTLFAFSLYLAALADILWRF